MDEQVNIIIFSRDRACQLHACIESFLSHFKETKDSKIQIIYKASNTSFMDGYTKIQEYFHEHVNIVWVEETDFKENVCVVTEESNASWTIFLVDDIIFINNFSLEDTQMTVVKDNPMILATSLRLHKNVNHCYATNTPQKIPKFTKKMFWCWKESEGDWQYSFSVDGNVYNSNFIKPLVKKLGYNNPNTFEAALDDIKHTNGVPTYMSCYPEEPKLVNIPANRVQNTYQNRYAKGYTAEELNKFYLEDKIIDIRLYEGIKYNTVHIPIELKFRNKLS